VPATWYLVAVEADDLRASRARIASAASTARRGHERALHDGVQQDLIAAGVRLQLARELIASDPTAAIALLDELRDAMHDALDRVRGLADEIYPSVLEVRGLPDALRHAVRATGVTARLDADGVGRYPETLEAAVYFCCRALLAETAVALALRDDGESLQLEIEGVEANDAARDLAEAAGGSVTTQSNRVIATFPRDTGSRP
jgi:signal transduction histidine kinase